MEQFGTDHLTGGRLMHFRTGLMALDEKGNPLLRCPKCTDWKSVPASFDPETQDLECGCGNVLYVAQAQGIKTCTAFKTAQGLSYEINWTNKTLTCYFTDGTSIVRPYVKVEDVQVGKQARFQIVSARTGLIFPMATQEVTSITHV